MTMTSEPKIDIDPEAIRAFRIIESMPGHAWAADAVGKFTYVSPGTLVYLGGSQDDLNRHDEEDDFGWRSVVHPDDYDRVVSRWRHCLATGEDYDTEHRLRGADGTYRWFRNSGRPTRDGGGRIIAWHGTTIDVDGQKRAEALLRERERELSQLVDLVPGHLWRLTAEGDPVFFNRRMVEFIGFDVMDAVRPGTSRLAAVIERIVHPDDLAEITALLNRSLATGERFCHALPPQAL